MIPAKFDYIRASSISEAISLLEKHGEDAKLLAGGHSLLPTIKLRLNRPGVVIDIGEIDGMNSITDEGGEIVVGANCTHAEIASSDVVNSGLRVLAETASKIGDVQVRNRGTIGGSLAHADPAADYPATVIAAGAKIEVEGSSGPRTIDAGNFFTGIYETALNENEIITSVRFPKSSNGVYLKFPHPASRFAVVGCAAVRNGNSVGIGITGVGSTAYKATAAEDAFDGGNAGEASSHAVDGVEVLGDHFASAEYRSHLAKVFVKRALESLA